MAFNNSVFSNFAFTTSTSTIIAAQSNPTFSPPGASTFANIHSFVVTPTVSASGGVVTNAGALRVDSPTGATNNYNMHILGSAAVGFGGTPSQSYFLVGATISNTSVLNMVENASVYEAAAANDPNGIAETTAFNPPAATTYGSATGVWVAPTRGGAGAITSLLGLVVEQPTGGDSATVSNICAEFKGLTYHEQGVTFGVPGVGGYPNTGAGVLEVYTENETWSPTISGATTAGVGTYTVQNGYYHRIGAMLFLDVNLTWTAHTGAGSLLLTNLPFTVRNLTNYAPVAVVNFINVGYPNRTALVQYTPNTRIGVLTTTRTNNTNLPVAFDAAGSMRSSSMYIV